MSGVFVDALYWVASTNPHDQWHRKALEVEATLANCYSHTDCLSMLIKRERGITDVLTHDAHFTQEGFHILL